MHGLGFAGPPPPPPNGGLAAEASAFQVIPPGERIVLPTDRCQWDIPVQEQHSHPTPVKIGQASTKICNLEVVCLLDLQNYEWL